MKDKARSETNPADSPTAWMFEYESAIKRQNWERAAIAKRELERLGVRVRFTPRAVLAAIEGQRDER